VNGVRRALTRLRRGMRPDDGVSLMEMVVSMAVGSILLAAVGALTVKMIGYLDAQDKRNAATQQMGTAMDLTAKQIRTTFKPPGNRPAVLLAGPETYGFYANLQSLPVGGAVNPTAAPATFTPEEVWIWTETLTTGRERLCDQVRPLTVDAKGVIVPPVLDLSVTGNRTCHEVIANVSAVASNGSPAPATFRYLDADDPLGSKGVSTSSLALDAAGKVVTTTAIQAVEITVTVNAGTRKRPVVVTATNRITYVNPQN
jgi:prepilin-type N-terminal cleavage/methylation domain-containing protein